MNADLPTVFKHHVFTCFQQRPPGHPRGSCMGAGAKPLWDRLQAKLNSLQNPDIALTATGCLGFCRAGPLMVIYPKGVWYAPRTEADIDEIFQSHLLEDKLVERLVIVPQP